MTPLSQGEKKRGDSWRSVMAKNVLRFANDSRVHEGERLCKRAVRHARDSASPTMFQSTSSDFVMRQEVVNGFRTEWANAIVIGTGVRYHPRKKH